MFNNAPKHNIKYSVYTGDDESTTEAHIRQKVGYKVDKLSDIIHMKRSLTTRIYHLRKNGRFPMPLSTMLSTLFTPEMMSRQQRLIFVKKYRL
jgi:hypothetical protein